MCADNSPILPKVVSGGKASVALPLAGRPKIFVAAANVCNMARFYLACLWACVCVYNVHDKITTPLEHVHLCGLK